MCTTDSPKAIRVLRNGMDYEPKKTYPPDYSNVIDVRSWQMSPFSQERFDLNEIQIAEKKGIKGKAELEQLMKKYGKGKGTKSEEPRCPKCAEREKAELQKNDQPSCGVNYLYQPYGPTMLSTASFRDAGVSKNKVFCFSGLVFSDFKVNRNNPQLLSSPLPCKTYGGQDYKKQYASHYIPYGPTGKRFTTFNYEPMGPPLKFK